MTRPLRALILLYFLGASAPAFAQAVAEREVEICRTLFDTGKYQEARARALSSLATLAFADAQKIELHQYAGAASFNLGSIDNAKASFLEVLRLNPDFELDPFRFPPPAVKLYESVRKSNAEELEKVRQLIVVAKEKARLEAKAKAEAAAREKLTSPPQNVVIRTVRTNILVNFLPFGVGQFQQGRVGLGVTLAISESLLAIVSIVGFWAIESLFENIVYELPDRVTADNKPFRFSLRRIPERQRTVAENWRAVKYGAGAGFYAVWLAGVIDALLHHQPETSSEVRQGPAGLGASISFSPNAGGASAAVTFHF